MDRFASLDLSDEALIASITTLRAALHRSFYISLSLSLIVSFLVYEETVGSTVSTVKRYFSESLEVQESVLTLSDALVEEPSVLRRYSQFLSPYIAISSAAEQAIVGVDGSDSRWLALDPEARDLARSLDDGVSWLEEMTTFYLGDDMRALHVENLKDFSLWLSFPEPRFDNDNARRVLAASEEVAIALGQNIEPRDEWPETFYFHDFVAEQGPRSVADAVEALRESFSMQDIRLAVDRIDQLCIDNEINHLDCTPDGIARIFADEPNRLATDEADQISIEFFPIGIDRNLLLGLSPPLLLVVFFQFVGHERRWRELTTPLSDDRRDGALPVQILWTLTDALSVSSLRASEVTIFVQGVVMMLFLAGALALPAIALSATLWLGVERGWSLAWLAGTGICLILIAIGLFAVAVMPRRPRRVLG